jgi:hypothetical protein
MRLSSHLGQNRLCECETIWSGDGAFDSYMIYFSIIISVLSLGVEIGTGAPGDCKDCAMSWESFALLVGFLDLWQRWRWWVGFDFDLGVGAILCWVSDLQSYWRVCYLWSWRRLQMIGCGVMV